MNNNDKFHGTTIVGVRRGKEVVVGGDGQVTLGNTVMKNNAKKYEDFTRIMLLLVLQVQQQMLSRFLKNLRANLKSTVAI